ncbi:MAG: energy-coupling factor ABC transporter ATP-binding protein [Planctomycetaceae bacterium]|jgi:cobalt/nickel transport system ATP-binding protein|nr:energy-coupling factor ABC transporter ATP-binding protein [Planctomycetaceae bacterium]
MTNIILQIENLSFTYPNHHQALADVNFQIEKGEKVFFHGSNGAGKTTLFQCINGLLKIKQGLVRFNGRVVKSEMERMKLISIVFQNAEDQIIAGSVFDEVAFGPINRGLPKKDVIKKVEQALQIMNIEHLRNKPPHFLSYGEKKRVTIASILSMEQEIIILDEPTAGLDGQQKEELVEILNSLANEGRTLLISTHESDFSLRCADRIIVLDQGKLLAEGKAEEIFSRYEILKKASLVKPIIMEVYEKLCEYSYIESNYLPKDIKELSTLLNQKNIQHPLENIVLNNETAIETNSEIT